MSDAVRCCFAIAGTIDVAVAHAALKFSHTDTAIGACQKASEFFAQ